MVNIENKYFINGDKYNCPFCDNNSVMYKIQGVVVFDETNNKKKKAIYVKCNHCLKLSMHISKTDLNISYHDRYGNSIICNNKSFSISSLANCNHDVFLINIDRTVKDIDSCIILNIPTSFFTINESIPKKLRLLVMEAETCIRSNALTGASACIRKAIYELLDDKKAKGDRYEDKIKSLEIDNEYISILSSIQGITSDQVHEDSYKNFDSQHVKLYIELLKEIFNEIYVLPQEKLNKKNKILQFSEIVKDDRDKNKETK